jgi:hypothetical protein
MAPVHSDLAWLLQMVGSGCGRYSPDPCHMCLSFAKAMVHSWCNRPGEFQHTLSECYVLKLMVALWVSVACASSTVLPVGDAKHQNVS